MPPQQNTGCVLKGFGQMGVPARSVSSLEHRPSTEVAATLLKSALTAKLKACKQDSGVASGLFRALQLTEQFIVSKNCTSAGLLQLKEQVQQALIAGCARRSHRADSAWQTVADSAPSATWPSHGPRPTSSRLASRSTAPRNEVPLRTSTGPQARGNGTDRSSRGSVTARGSSSSCGRPSQGSEIDLSLPPLYLFKQANAGMTDYFKLRQLKDERAKAEDRIAAEERKAKKRELRRDLEEQMKVRERQRMAALEEKRAEGERQRKLLQEFHQEEEEQKRKEEEKIQQEKVARAAQVEVVVRRKEEEAARHAEDARAQILRAQAELQAETEQRKLERQRKLEEMKEAAVQNNQIQLRLQQDKEKEKKEEMELAKKYSKMLSEQEAAREAAFQQRLERQRQILATMEGHQRIIQDKAKEDEERALRQQADHENRLRMEEARRKDDAKRRQQETLDALRNQIQEQEERRKVEREEALARKEQLQIELQRARKEEAARKAEQKARDRKQGEIIKLQSMEQLKRRYLDLKGIMSEHEKKVNQPFVERQAKSPPTIQKNMPASMWAF